MRHHLSGRQLSRNAPHRHALLRSLSVSLLRHETIRTTVPKAKELRRVVEPLITLGKDDSEANRRLAFARLRDSEIVAKLFDTIGPRFKARPGGYTRILHMAPRPGDNAPMALMQLVERSAPMAVEAAPEDKKAKKAEAPKVDKAEKKAKAEAKKGREKAAKEAKAAKAVAKKAAKKTGGVAKKKKAAAKKKKSFEVIRSLPCDVKRAPSRRPFRFRAALACRAALHVSCRTQTPGRAMGLAKEFKEFAMKGNVIDMAVGVVIGAAFGKIITSIVEDVIMPPLGMLIGGVNFTDLAVSLGTEPDGKDVLLKYGNFLQIDVSVPDRRLRAVHADPHDQQAQEAGSGRAAAARRRARKCCCTRSATCSRRSNRTHARSMAAVRYPWMFRTAAVVYLLFGLSGLWRFGLTDYDPAHRPCWVWGSARWPSSSCPPLNRHRVEEPDFRTKFLVKENNEYSTFRRTLVGVLAVPPRAGADAAGHGLHLSGPA